MRACNPGLELEQVPPSLVQTIYNQSLGIGTAKTISHCSRGVTFQGDPQILPNLLRKSSL